MKWEIAASTSRQEIYELWHEYKWLLTLDFHTSTNSARIQYAHEKRVFMIRKEGFLRNKTVLCNEYGIRLGHLVHENKENYIELNHERFSYDTQHNNGSELIIYKESRNQPLVVCGLNIKKDSALSFSGKNHPLPDNVYSSLVLALCWYILLPVVKKTAVEYAM